MVFLMEKIIYNYYIYNAFFKIIFPFKCIKYTVIKIKIKVIIIACITIIVNCFV